MSKELNRYIKIVRKKANEYENCDVNGQEVVGFFSKRKRMFICLVITLPLVFLLKNGFSNMFISYISTILSIFIGLFSTALIFSFDLYKKSNLMNASSTKILLDIQSYNYTKKFSFITGYSIILSIYSLIILSLSSLFDGYFSMNIYNYEFILNDLKYENFLLLINGVVVVIQRFIVLYWVSVILYRTLFIISSMVVFMDVKKEVNE